MIRASFKLMRENILVIPKIEWQTGTHAGPVAACIGMLKISSRALAFN
jgi:hypothetical protein